MCVCVCLILIIIVMMMSTNIIIVIIIIKASEALKSSDMMQGTTPRLIRATLARAAAAEITTRRVRVVASTY